MNVYNVTDYCGSVTTLYKGLHVNSMRSGKDWEGLEVESLWSPWDYWDSTGSLCGIPGIIGTPVGFPRDLWGSVRYSTK